MAMESSGFASLGASGQGTISVSLTLSYFTLNYLSLCILSDLFRVSFHGIYSAVQSVQGTWTAAFLFPYPEL